MSENLDLRIQVIRLKRIANHNNELKELLKQENVYVSNASYGIIDYCQTNSDPFLSKSEAIGPSPYIQKTDMGKDPGCCTIV